MKKIMKSAVTIGMLTTFVASMCINSFAASFSSKGTAMRASQELVDVCCNYYSLLKDTFTVKNNGTVAMWVYVNGAYTVELDPGESYTHKKSHAFKHRVQVYAKKKALGTNNQKVSITSTSGKIYKM